MEFWQTWEVDTHENIELVEFYLWKWLTGQSWKRIDASGIDLIALDFDGVLTDNRAILREDGMEAVAVNRADGLGVSGLKALGYVDP